jgi:DNA-binding CsgD family transcriptional regulator
MKNRNDLNITFMGNLQKAWYASEIADTQDIQNLLQQFRSFGGFIHHTLPVFYVLDYTAQQYLMMTNEMQSIAGYHPSEFIESRLEKLIEVYHKDDFKIFNQQVFTYNTAFLKQTPQEDHHQYIFSYNFRLARHDKKFAHVLQRNSFITSKETGLPLYSFGMIIDITEFKTDTVMVHTIAKGMGEEGNKQLVRTNYFYPNFEETLLTRREKLVLQYLSEGQSSKQVADKLFLSEYTVVNHKQNMLRKTNTKNVTELVVFAIRNRLI